MKIFSYIIQYAVFPGFLFSISVGLMAGWLDRKVTARIQWRKGPPWYQNFIDVMKLLFYKETLTPRDANRPVFLMMPVIGLAGSVLASMLIFRALGSSGGGFIGDIIVVVYLLMIPAIALIIGGFASGNPLASLGASRETKLLLSYELPFIITLIVPIMKSGGSLELSGIAASQAALGSNISYPSGALAFLAMLFCIQAKLGLVPFDIAEAETEIMAGTCIEYSGKALGFLKMTKAVLLACVPALLVVIFFGGMTFDLEGIMRALLQYLFIVIMLVLIKNTNPRVRIDQAMRFFWAVTSSIAVIAAVLAYFGY